jgi:hypothetical protein
MNIDEQKVGDLEAELFDPKIRHSEERLNQLLADDFIEYTSSGRQTTKQDTIALLGTQRNLKIESTNLHVLQLANSVILVRYEARKTDLSNGSVKDSFRSSIWRKNGEQWQIVFHQGTPKQ